MKCSRCFRPRPLALWIVGIAFDTATRDPVAIEYRCVCGELRYVAWAAVTRAEREQAYLAEMSRQQSEMMMGRG